MDRIIVIGAGAAGLMAAGTAAKRGNNVILFDKNSRPGKKVRITGKGRCNVTNDCNELSELISNVPVNGRFLYSAFSSFMPSDTIEFFESSKTDFKIITLKITNQEKWLTYYKHSQRMKLEYAKIIKSKI